MLAVADAIEAEAVAEFDMCEYFANRTVNAALNRQKRVGHCGTSACIAGFTMLLYPPKSKTVITSPFSWAKHTLDLTDEAAEVLFIDSVTLFADRPRYTASWLRDLAQGEKTFSDLKEEIKYNKEW